MKEETKELFDKLRQTLPNVDEKSKGIHIL